MAKLWITYREGLRLLGTVIAEVPLAPTIAKLDIAPWRLFATKEPEHVSPQQAQNAPERKLVLLQVGAEDRYDLCGFVAGFFDSPYTLEECLRRLDRAPAISSATGAPRPGNN